MSFKRSFILLLSVVLFCSAFLFACKEDSQTTETTVTTTTQPATTEAVSTVPATTEAETPPVIVVLDAGHDTDKHTRNQPQLGFNEQDLNFKITMACFERLSEYEGVEIHLTRTGGECPNADGKYEDCIMARTKVATKVGADMFVSFHCNATTGSLGASANGACVFVSKHPDYYDESAELGNLILTNLCCAVDIANDGVMTRSKPEKGYYPNGTVKDWYYLISNNIDDGQPSVIIEHAFMDNSHDNAILKDDENLKKMGIADADAIAQYFDLELK